jgi:hypothetical protein
VTLLSSLRVLGIEFAASQTTYVLLERSKEGIILVNQSDRLSLGGTRSCDALRAYQSAVQTLLNDTAPDLIAIKDKPEKGGMRAGAAALKMEGILLANATCAVTFVSGARINKCTAADGALHAYRLPAFKAAHVALADGK